MQSHSNVFLKSNIEFPGQSFNVWLYLYIFGVNNSVLGCVFTKLPLCCR